MTPYIPRGIIIEAQLEQSNAVLLAARSTWW
jgi:hypothetical protein